MKSLIISILVLFLSFCAFTYLKSKNLVNEFDRQFESEYYTDYRAQLLTFLDTSHKGLSKDSFVLLKLKETLEQPSFNPEQLHFNHANFTQQLREILTSNPSNFNSNEQIFLQKFIKFIFTQIDLKPSTSNYFYSQFSQTTANFLSFIQLTKLLIINPYFSGLKHDHLHYEDQYLKGNLPFTLFNLSNHAQTTVIRMGYPLNSIRKMKNPTPYPEAALFFKSQSHLYVNLMRRSSKEKEGSLALESLEKEYPLLHVVTLDKNSPFYWQKNQSAQLVEADFFKESYFEQLVNPSGNYYWSTSLPREFWHEELKKSIEEIHQKYFGNQPQLNQKERLNFIELSYLNILDKLTEILQPASMNITCRQCMDRGPSLYVLWMLYHQKITIKEAKALLLTPPLLMHNRSSHLKKVKRFVLAKQKLQLKSLISP